MGTIISEASKRVPIFSCATQGGKQAVWPVSSAESCAVSGTSARENYFCCARSTPPACAAGFHCSCSGRKNASRIIAWPQQRRHRAQEQIQSCCPNTRACTLFSSSFSPSPKFEQLHPAEISFPQVNMRIKFCLGTRHTGHAFIADAHRSQTHRWPHGVKAITALLSRHTTHASWSLRFCC